MFQNKCLLPIGGGADPATITCEIQIATELSTKIWEETHSIYEGTRENFEKPSEWQWKPKDPRFISRQLCHMMHLADGLLMQLRESINAKKYKGE